MASTTSTGKTVSRVATTTRAWWGTLDYVVDTTVTPATVTITTHAVAMATANGQLFGFVTGGTTEDGFHAYSGILGANHTDGHPGVPGCSNCRASFSSFDNSPIGGGQS